MADIIATEDKTVKQTFTNQNQVPHPLQLTKDTSSLAIQYINDERILVGHEKGCYLSHLDVSNNKTENPSDSSCTEISYTQGREVQALCRHHDGSTYIFWVASGKEIFAFDDRVSFDKPVFNFGENLDEINQIICNESGHLVTCDDSGESKIFDIRANKLFRTLRRRHTGICSTVSFLSNRPNEVVTGGLDSQIIIWDYNRVKPLQTINTQNMLQEMGDNSVYMFNPPFVYAIDVCESGQQMAAGLGNGTLQIFDVCKGKKILRPRLLVNHHSSLGVSAVHFIQASNENKTNFLLTGGNDQYINLWSFPENSKSTKKQPMANTVCTEQEIDNYLLTQCDMNSKINFIHSCIINNRTYVFVADQTCAIKMLQI